MPVKPTSPFEIPPHDVAGRYSVLCDIPQLKAHLSAGSWPSWDQGLYALEHRGHAHLVGHTCLAVGAQGNTRLSSLSPCPGFYSWGFTAGQGFSVTDTGHIQRPSKEESAKGKVPA